MASLDDHKDLEIFVITNGRETFDYVMRSIEEQSIHRKVTVIRDMKWIDALNECVRLCKSECFLRVDDDMLLHKYALSYYASRVPRMKPNKCGVFVCRLWEWWSDKPVNGLRMYSVDAVNRVGGFRTSELGKVDKVFRTDLIKHRRRQIKDGSLVGIHALASEEDQKKYRKLWKKNASISADEFEDTFDNLIHKTSKDLNNQYNILREMRKLNKPYGTPYLLHINEERERENAQA